MYTTKHFIKPDFIHLFVSKNDIQSMKIANIRLKGVFCMFLHTTKTFTFTIAMIPHDLQC